MTERRCPIWTWSAASCLGGLLAASLPLVGSGCGIFRSKSAEAVPTVAGAGSPRSSPKAGTAAVDEARALKEQGRDDEALSLLIQAIETNPTLTVAHMELGDIYAERGDHREAEPRYARAAELQPASFDAQFKHGRSLQLLERISEAIRAYLRALAIRPDDPEANLLLGTAYLQINEPAQALAYAQRAVERQPTNGVAHANLGAVYSALERHADAVRAYESAAELMELTPALLLNLAESLGKIQRYEQMNNTLEELARLGPSAACHERRGFALFKMRRYPDAEQAFRDSLAFDSTYYPALNGLGVCLLNNYINSGKEDQRAREEAIAMLRQSLQANRRQPRILELLTRYGG